MFKLHKRLEEDTVFVKRLELSRVLLMNDSTVPWLILVPELEGVTELYALSKADRAVLMEETALASLVIKGLYNPDKMNIGALGNLVPQLHIHVIGRFTGDRAWPGPVWGAPGAKAYAPEKLTEEAARIKKAFGNIQADFK